MKSEYLLVEPTRNEDTLIIDWQKLTSDYLLRNQLKKHRRVGEKPGFYHTKSDGVPRFPPSLQLRDYQQTAVVSWFRNQGRGTLKMATGSGKTIVALAIATELYDKIGSTLSLQRF